MALEVLNSRLSIVHYDGGEIEAEKAGVELILRVDDSIHETRQGGGFELVVNVKDAETEPVAITHVAILGPSGCTCPMKTMAVWWNEGEADPDLDVYDSRSVALRLTPPSEWGSSLQGEGKPNLIIQTRKPFFDALVPLEQPVSPGHIHINLRDAYRSGDKPIMNNLDIQTVAFLGYTGETARRVLAEARERVERGENAWGPEEHAPEVPLSLGVTRLLPEPGRLNPIHSDTCPWLRYAPCVHLFFPPAKQLENPEDDRRAIDAVAGVVAEVARELSHELPDAGLCSVACTGDEHEAESLLQALEQSGVVHFTDPSLPLFEKAKEALRHRALMTGPVFFCPEPITGRAEAREDGPRGAPRVLEYEAKMKQFFHVPVNLSVALGEEDEEEEDREGDVLAHAAAAAVGAGSGHHHHDHHHDHGCAHGCDHHHHHHGEGDDDEAEHDADHRRFLDNNAKEPLRAWHLWVTDPSNMATVGRAPGFDVPVTARYRWEDFVEADRDVSAIPEVGEVREFVNAALRGTAPRYFQSTAPADAETFASPLVRGAVEVTGRTQTAVLRQPGQDVLFHSTLALDRDQKMLRNLSYLSQLLKDRAPEFRVAVMSLRANECDERLLPGGEDYDTRFFPADQPQQAVSLRETKKEAAKAKKGNPAAGAGAAGGGGGGAGGGGGGGGGEMDLSRLEGLTGEDMTEADYAQILAMMSGMGGGGGGGGGGGDDEEEEEDAGDGFSAASLTDLVEFVVPRLRTAKLDKDDLVARAHAIQETVDLSKPTLDKIRADLAVVDRASERGAKVEQEEDLLAAALGAGGGTKEDEGGPLLAPEARDRLLEALRAAEELLAPERVVEEGGCQALADATDAAEKVAEELHLADVASEHRGGGLRWFESKEQFDAVFIASMESPHPTVILFTAEQADEHDEAVELMIRMMADAGKPGTSVPEGTDCWAADILKVDGIQEELELEVVPSFIIAKEGQPPKLIQGVSEQMMRLLVAM